MQLQCGVSVEKFNGSRVFVKGKCFKLQYVLRYKVIVSAKVVYMRRYPNWLDVAS